MGGTPPRLARMPGPVVSSGLIERYSPQLDRARFLIPTAGLLGDEKDRGSSERILVLLDCIA